MRGRARQQWKEVFVKQKLNVKIQNIYHWRQKQEKHKLQIQVDERQMLKSNNIHISQLSTMEAKLKTDPNRISETRRKSPPNLERVDGNEIRRSHPSRHMILLTIKYNFLYLKTNIMINVILYI